MTDGSLGSLLLLLLPLLLLVYVAMSARKRQRAMDDFASSLAVGERVVTTSGIYGEITALDDATAQLQIAPGTTITIDRRAVGVRQDDVATPGRSTDTPPSDKDGQ